MGVLNFGSVKRRVPSAGTTIALLALTLSVVQLVVTAPMLLALVYKPNVVVSCQGVEVQVKMAVCDLVNEGNMTATGIEIGFGIEQDQRVVVMQGFASSVEAVDSYSVFKQVRVNVERLHPGESVVIIVAPGERAKRLTWDEVKSLARNGKNIPVISYVRSAEGVGEIRRGVLSGAAKRLNIQFH